MRPELINFSGFIRNLYGDADYIPLHEPRFIGCEKKLVIECLDSTFVSSSGNFIDQFEQELADFTNSKYAIATSSGTSALHISLILAGVKHDSEVITQSMSFVATCNAIRYCGAKPIFVDIDRNTLGLSADSLSEFLKTYAKIRENKCINTLTNKHISSCVPMHTFGHPCEIDKIKEICSLWKIPLVEDAAESLGSTYKGKYTGTFGLLSAVSFNGNKIITAGGGGAILTNDFSLAKKAKHLVSTAKIPHKWEYKHDAIGYNYRMPNLNAALVCAQLKQLQNYLLNKRQTAGLYADFCHDNNLNFLLEVEGCKSNYWLNSIILKDQNEQQDFIRYTNKKGIGTRPTWSLLHKLKIFKKCFSMPQNNSTFYSERLVNIPSSVRINN
jgi:perosamine synthetase